MRASNLLKISQSLWQNWDKNSCFAWPQNPCHFYCMTPMYYNLFNSLFFTFNFVLFSSLFIYSEPSHPNITSIQLIVNKSITSNLHLNIYQKIINSTSCSSIPCYKMFLYTYHIFSSLQKRGLRDAKCPSQKSRKKK